MASVVQQIWIEGDRVSDASGGATAASQSVLLASAPTTGNLLVMYAVGRNTTSAPTITFAGGSSEVVTVAGSATPMEFHTLAIGYRVVESGDSSTWTASYSIDSHSRKVGIVEFDLTDAVLDASSFAGSNTSNVSSIATGSTGTLSSSTGLWFSAGTSRTGSAGLTEDEGGTLLFESGATHDDTTAGGTNATDPQDHATANSAASWANLAATTALNITWSESSGSSRMGAGIVVFVESATGTTVDPVASSSASSSDTAVVVATVTITPVGSTSAASSAVAGVVATVTVDPAASTSATTSAVAGVVTTATADPVGSVSATTSATAGVVASVTVEPVGSSSASSADVADITSGATFDPIGSTSATSSDTADVVASVTIAPTGSTSAAASAVAGVVVSVTVTPVASASATGSATADITGGVSIEPTGSTSAATSDTASITATITVDPAGSVTVTTSAVGGVIATAEIDPAGSVSAASSGSVSLTPIVSNETPVIFYL